MSHSDKTLTRRRFVEATGVATAVGLAGCDGDGGEGTATATGTGTDGGSDNTLNVLHGWTGTDGSRAADALFSTFQEEYPDVPVNEEPIGGGGNQNLDTVVSNRLQAGNPPSSFANWPGPNLQAYSGALGDIDDVWEENDFEGAHIGEAAELHQMDGTYRAVPLGSHQLNHLFYNIPVVEEAGVDPSGITDMSSLIDALDAVSTETDYVPMTQLMSGTWGTSQLWAQTMLGKEGYQPYMDFINGEGSEDAVRSAFETVGEILENYISEDAASLNLTTSMENITAGEAAFIHQGNWAAGAFRNAEDFAYEEDWGHIPYPGTDNMYTLHFDSMLYPGDNPSPENTRTWLSYVGNEDAQIAYNQYKGSIPTRTDVSLDAFGPYLQASAEEFANAEHRPPTIQHGLAVTADVMTSFNDALSANFTGPYDVDAVTSAYMDAV